MSFALKLWLGNLFLARAIAAPGQVARQTVFLDNPANGLGWHPMPTPATALLQKRQAVGHNTCGYINGEIGEDLRLVLMTRCGLTLMSDSERTYLPQSVFHMHNRSSFERDRLLQYSISRAI